MQLPQGTHWICWPWSNSCRKLPHWIQIHPHWQLAHPHHGQITSLFFLLLQLLQPILPWFAVTLKPFCTLVCEQPSTATIPTTLWSPSTTALFHKLKHNITLTCVLLGLTDTSLLPQKQIIQPWHGPHSHASRWQWQVASSCIIFP